MSFTNWTENISNPHSVIRYPRNDDEIVALIKEARENDEIIRVVGNGHSQSPSVCDSSEPVVLISMSNYSVHPYDYVLDRTRNEVTVNAGWTLGKLYDRLNLDRYFLDTQTAGTFFTLGGLISMPTHGGRIGGCFISDGVVRLTLIDDRGYKVVKSINDPDFAYYRMGLGVHGVITTITFRLHQMPNLKKTITTTRAAFINGRANREVFDNRVRQIIANCLDPSGPARYHHSVIDFHNDVWLSLEWESSDKPCIWSNEAPELDCLDKSDFYDKVHTYLVPNYRRNPDYLKFLSKAHRAAMHAFIAKDYLEDNDMFWVHTACRIYFMSYFIPIHVEGNEVDLRVFYEAIESIKELTTQFAEEKSPFNLDFPMDLRFVTTNPQLTTVASPLRSINGKKTVYIAVEAIAGASNLDLNAAKRNWLTDFFLPSPDVKLNQDFYRFMTILEKKWVALGGVPHYAKIYGFDDGKVTSSAAVRKVFSSEQKALLAKRASPLFTNKYIRTLLS